SAFFATDLALTLREQGVQTVVLAGVKTNVCVRATAQDAFAHGFDVFVPREATNSNRPHLGDASLEDISRYIGRVGPLDEALGLNKAQRRICARADWLVAAVGAPAPCLEALVALPASSSVFWSVKGDPSSFPAALAHALAARASVIVHSSDEAGFLAEQLGP